ncbi:NAD(P)-binding protein [Xylariaceae sp. FL0662B]|nr:NAD(P)-binding protein [Xylariaceae sp. FL0662B]
MASTHPFQGKVIMVTSASQGTGLALPQYLLVRRATVSTAATSADNLATAPAGIEKDLPECKYRVLTRVVDISKSEMVKKWIDETMSRFGKLDGCANVAAQEQRKIHPITDLDHDYFRHLMDVNVGGTFNYLKEEMKNIKDGGSIVNVGSVTSHYASRALLPPRHIRDNALCLGAINSEMMAKPFESPMREFRLTGDTVPCRSKRIAEPEEIAASIAFLLGDESKYITKATRYADGVWLEGTYSR